MYKLDEDILLFLGFDKSVLNKEKEVSKALYRHLDKLSKNAFHDRQLLIANLLVLARDACDCGSELFLPICYRVREECNKANYKLK